MWRTPGNSQIGDKMTFPAVLSIRARLTDEEAALRQALLQRLASFSLPTLPAGEPPPVTWAEAGAALGWPPEHAAAVGAALVAKKLAGQDAAGHVRYTYPVSASPTAHRVTLADGRTLYAMCAIDSLGSAWTFGQPVQVEARCHVCGEPVHVRVHGPAQVESQPPGAYATHVDLNKYDDWAANT